MYLNESISKGYGLPHLKKERQVVNILQTEYKKEMSKFKGHNEFIKIEDSQKSGINKKMCNTEPE